MVSVGDSAATGTSAAKMKILLLDKETVGLSSLTDGRSSRANSFQVSIVSTATTQSALLNHEVYLTEYLSLPNNRLDTWLMLWKSIRQPETREDAPSSLPLLRSTVTGVNTGLD